MINVDHAFTTTGETVSELFNRPGQGFYIPLYQRPYSWGRENVDQLTEDITDGVDEMIRNDDSIRFLGTIITISVRDKVGEINPVDPKGIPTEVEKIIDGQQRLSTIALLGTELDRAIRLFVKRLPKEAPYADLRGAAEGWIGQVQDLYSLDLNRGAPQRKPKVIRGQEDTWTFEGDDDVYQSAVAAYLAAYVRHAVEGAPQPKVGDFDKQVASNLRRMRRAVQEVAEAHLPSSGLNGSYPSGATMLHGDHGFKQEYIWSYDRQELADLLTTDPADVKSPEGVVSALAQLFAFVHYLMKRCCVTLIKPTHEDWAFDMFQSLNATGTPLTAVETFKPRVVQFEGAEGGYKGSPSQEHFDLVDELMGTTDNPTQKSKLTDRLLISFALAWSGERLSKRFSEQRRWLQASYEAQADADDKRAYTGHFADAARFYAEVWEGYDGDGVLDPIAGASDAAVVSTCLLYLRDANHSIAPAVLAQFYAGVLAGDDGAVGRFNAAVKAVTAFYTLWRSVRTNSGLDAVYRSLMRGGEATASLNWSTGDAPDVDRLRGHFAGTLQEIGVGERARWVARTHNGLRYDGARAACRFALFIAADDTVPDPSAPGLMKPGTSGCSEYLRPETWRDPGLKEVEHVAPVSPKSDDAWDDAIYSEDRYHEVGNLTLLPKEINASAGNHGFERKLLYYQHLGLDDPQAIERLQQEAEARGIELAESTVAMLQDVQHQAHLRPVIERSSEDGWDAEFVRSRTERIAEILWDRLAPWVGVG